VIKCSASNTMFRLNAFICNGYDFIKRFQIAHYEVNGFKDTTTCQGK